MNEQKFQGYRRDNGRVGIRNHVVILPLDDLSNAACEAVANNIKGTLAIPHAYGRLQFGEDLELFFRTIIGTGSNPNVAACVVIGIEPEWTARVVDGIKALGRTKVAGVSIERHGDIQTIAAASRQAFEFMQWASERKRETCDVSELYVSVKCGESDTTSGLASCPTVGNVVDRLVEMNATASFGETSEITGAEDICASRAATPEVAEQYMKIFTEYDAFIKSQGVDLMGSQPTKGNIRGGLTTIEEKALGNLQKIGKKAKFVGCLAPAEAPKGKGLWYMDTSSAAAEAVTLWAASGAVVHLFPTGQGNIIGNPIEPVIKLTANPLTARTMAEHVDVDVTGILRREMTLDQAGDKLYDMMMRVCNGRLTCQEILGHREFVLTKLYRSA
ncbi:MAG: UxaA family hydrolase [Candidatus Sumerlaeota bacterium]|nr:UxaA family hydrolase [Candidatus Sumerlaeota bacterium]